MKSSIPVIAMMPAFLIVVISCIYSNDDTCDRNTSVEADHESIDGFSFVREEAYFCGEIENTVEIYKHEKTGLEFLLLPGNDDIEPFLISRTETTQKAWKEIIGTEEWCKLGTLHPYVEEGDDYPAVFITRDEAIAFCRESGLRLPSEKEWMYACRAGSETKHFFGDDESKLDEYAWHCGNAEGVGEIYAHRVGLKKPNAFGLLDMYGNVSEWCNDLVPREDEGLSIRTGILCGGSYSLFDPNPTGFEVDWTSVPRTEQPVNDGSTWLGFRPACSLTR